MKSDLPNPSELEAAFEACLEKEKTITVGDVRMRIPRDKELFAPLMGFIPKPTPEEQRLLELSRAWDKAVFEFLRQKVAQGVIAPHPMKGWQGHDTIFVVAGQSKPQPSSSTARRSRKPKRLTAEDIENMRRWGDWGREAPECPICGARRYWQSTVMVCPRCGYTEC